MPAKKDIVYPIFLECCSKTTDIFWESVFRELAYGKPPHGTYISKDFLCCSYKNKEFSYRIERKDIDVLYNDIINLLVKKLGILSYREREKKKIEFHELEINIHNSRLDWSNIRKKNIKDILYENFVIDMKNEHSLSFKQCKQLLAIIFLGMAFKSLSPSDVEYRDNKIISISGIEFEHGKIIFNRSLYSSQVDIISETSECDDIEIKRISDNWDKYLKYLRNLEDSVQIK